MDIMTVCPAAGCTLTATLMSPWVPIQTALADNGAHAWMICMAGHRRAVRWTPDDVTDGWIGGPPTIGQPSEGMLL